MMLMGNLLGWLYLRLFFAKHTHLIRLLAIRERRRVDYVPEVFVARTDDDDDECVMLKMVMMMRQTICN